MLFFSCFLIAVVSVNSEVKALIPVAIGEDSTILPHEIAGSPVWQTYPPVPSTHPGYQVTNVGNSGILASIYWKDSSPLQTDDVFCEVRVNCSTNSSTNVWYELADPVHVEPSETVVVRPSAKASFYYTRLVVISNNPGNSSEAIVHVEYEDGAGSPRTKRDTKNSNFSASNNVKIVFMMGGGKLPATVTASGFEALIELFWPENHTSVWMEVRDQVKNLIDQETFCAINALLTGRLMGFKRKLQQIAREVKRGQSDVSSHYMNLAQDLIGLEEESIIRGHHNAKKLNEDLLPVYSNIILMKAAFYSLGLRFQQKIGLSKQNADNVMTYFTDLIRSPSNGANQHISQIFRNQSSSSFEYDKEMHMRNKLKEHGYVLVWNNMLDHPELKLVIDEIFYSEVMGRYYPSIGISPPLKDDPLTSYGLSKGKYNEVNKLILYQSNNGCALKSCCPDTIVGMKQIFKNGDTTEFGEITHVYRVIELNGTYRIGAIETRSIKTGHWSFANLHFSLLKLDKGEWINTTMDEYTFGCPSSDTFDLYSFKKQDYYIASMFPSFEMAPRNYMEYPMLHMGVSFLPIKSQLQNNVDEKNWKEWTF